MRREPVLIYELYEMYCDGIFDDYYDDLIVLTLEEYDNLDIYNFYKKEKENKDIILFCRKVLDYGKYFDLFDEYIKMEENYDNAEEFELFVLYNDVIDKIRYNY